MGKSSSLLRSVVAGTCLLCSLALLGEAQAQGRTTYSSGYRRTSTTRRARFVRREFSFAGRIKHDTNLIRRSIVLMSDDGIRRRIDVPRDIRVIDGRTQRLLSVHDLHNGDRIRISGVQTDRKRWRADQIRLLAKG